MCELAATGLDLAPLIIVAAIAIAAGIALVLLGRRSRGIGAVALLLLVAVGMATVGVPAPASAATCVTLRSNQASWNAGSLLLTNMITISNPSTAGAADVAVKVTGSGDFQLGPTTCTGSVAAGASCTVMLVFVPSGANGPRDAVLTVTGSNVSPLKIPLHGSVVPLATLQLDKTSHSYAAAGSTTFTVTNTSVTVSATGLTALMFGSTDFTVASNTCLGTLAPLASCTVDGQYSAATAGLQTATLRVTGTNTLPVLASLDGTPPSAVLSLSPDTYSFSDVGTQVFTVTNTSAVTATGLSQSLTSSAGVFSVLSISATTCGSTLAAASNCIITVNYPGSSTGETATLTVSATNGATVTADIVAFGLV